MMQRSTNHNAPPDELISVEEAARLVGLSRRGMYYRIERCVLEPPVLVVDAVPRLRINRRLLLEKLEREPVAKSTNTERKVK